ncbi:MFS transporter [Actinacidiphila yeochonensis]|uniref:MFS transporter n=1 Tax=Actinacidiphila yeochonensis TaxID=89050 RepID=UPI0005665CE1|nr:MFS transporter [Actinacidiphila yeochonensis]
MTATHVPPTLTRADTRLPLAALIVMAATVLVVIMTETMPAGLLPQIAGGIGVSEGAAGQFVSAYALGAVLAAIPAIVVTRGVRRKPLLIISLLGFLVANTLTALAPNLAVALAVRFVAGAFSGLLWGMLAGYAMRITPPEQAGRALAIAMSGTPIALAAGTPLGTWLGSATGWRWTFAAMSALIAVVLVAAMALVPDAPGQAEHTRLPFGHVLRLPGVATILGVVFVWMLAHNLMYAYIAPFLKQTNLDVKPDVALVVFGVAALVGLWFTGATVDRFLRPLVLSSVVLFIVAGAVLLGASGSTPLGILAIVLWGIAFGGSATQLQTATGAAAGANFDAAMGLVATSFNLAISAAGAVGGALVEGVGARSLPVAMIILAAVALVAVGFGRRAAFKPVR